MNTVWLCVAVLGCFVLKTTDAALGTNWTTPAISTIDGSGTIATALAEGETTTFPQLAVTNATDYIIISQIPAGIFTITAGNGKLALATNKTLDYEKAKTNVLVVKAGDGSTSGTATITIKVSDVNDNAPAFPASMYSACVVDKAKKGATVLTVSTTDVDTTTIANNISLMTIAAGDTNTNFDISTNGVITLAKAVNMTATAEYALRVEAIDSNPGTKLTGTTTVSVVVAEKCGGSDSGVGILAASLLTLLVGLATSLSSL